MGFLDKGLLQVKLFQWFWLDFTFGFMLGSLSWMGSNPSASSPALPVPGSCCQTGRGVLGRRAMLPTVQNIPPKGWYQEWFSVIPPVRVCGRALLSSWQWSGFSGQRRWIQIWLWAHFTHFPPAGSAAIVPPNPKQCRVHSKHERRRGRASQVPNTPPLSPFLRVVLPWVLGEAGAETGLNKRRFH